MASSDFDAASKGIMDPRPVTIGSDVTLYRFGSSKGKYGPMGPWWFREDVMARMRSAAEGMASRDPRKGDARTWLALNSRFLLAVKLEFSAADVLLGATTTAPLEAYAGPGRPMIDYLGADNPADATVTYTMAPKPWLEQLYICDFAHAKNHLNILNQEALPTALERSLPSQPRD